MLRWLIKVSAPEPVGPSATSPSYQPIPNGAFGSWIANRTSGVPGLKPLTVMTSFSAKPGVVSTWTEAVACSAQPSGRPWVRTILRLNEPAACAGWASEAPQASAAAARIRGSISFPPAVPVAGKFRTSWMAAGLSSPPVSGFPCPLAGVFPLSRGRGRPCAIHARNGGDDGEEFPEWLMPLAPADQHLVGGGLEGEAQAEEPVERGVRGAPAVDPEHELVELRLQVLRS